VSEVEIMPMHVDVQCMRAMLRVVIERLRAAEDELAALDAATGDGDHGAAMGKVASRIEACLDDAAHETPGALLEASGWSVMSIDAGSTGTLYGSWLLGFGEGCGASDTLDGSGLARGLDGSLTRLGTVTQAAVGDKTLIDALAPAVEAAKAAASEGLAPGVVMERVADAAERGAAATADMQAKFGRARNIGERSRGHVDPGAASMSICLRAMKEGLGDA
jgi:dihydroxyacetone kinase-like protein